MATGSVSLGERDESMVTVNLSGPTYFPNYSPGIESYYNVALTHFEPDNDAMAWQVTGSAKKNPLVAVDSFWQQGGLTPDFPLPAKAAKGKYHYTLRVSATETCSTDATKTLTGSATLLVTVNMTGGPPEMKAVGAVGDECDLAISPERNNRVRWIVLERRPAPSR